MRKKILSLGLATLLLIGSITIAPKATAEENDNQQKETKEQTMSIMMVGDDLLHTPISKSGKKANGKYNYDGLFSHIKKDVKACDLSMINQEVILGGAKLGISSYPSFNGRQEVGDSLVRTGFNVILHATNHALDKGAAGIKNTINYWEKKHPEIKFTGINKSQAQKDRITYFKKNGIKVAVLNYTYGTNGIGLPKGMPYAVNLMTKAKVKRDVTLAKKHADFIILCPHWGTEYNTGIDSSQKSWTKYFLKLGVNLVIGTHPHVCEPVKWVSDKAGHKMLVYYSLGNYINATSRRGAGVQKQFYGGMARVNLKRNVKGKVVIDKAKFVPLITHKAGNKYTTYKVSDYTKALAKKNGIKGIDGTFSYKKMKNFFKKLINKKFL